MALGTPYSFALQRTGPSVTGVNATERTLSKPWTCCVIGFSLEQARVLVAMTLVLERILHSPTQGLLRAHFQLISSSSFTLIIPFPNTFPRWNYFTFNVNFKTFLRSNSPFFYPLLAHFRSYSRNLLIFTPCELSKRPNCGVTI